MNNKKILIVEDEEKIAEVMTAYLEKDGFNVQSTTSGLNAVKLIKELRPNLVVLDLMLPDLSGEEICTQVRRFSDVPIIMVTADRKSVV